MWGKAFNFVDGYWLLVIGDSLFGANNQSPITNNHDKE
jgi:hypothetical protein